MDAQDMGNALERILVTEDELARRMAELAAEIDADYQGKQWDCNKPPGIPLLLVLSVICHGFTFQPPYTCGARVPTKGS